MLWRIQRAVAIVHITLALRAITEEVGAAMIEDLSHDLELVAVVLTLAPSFWLNQRERSPNTLRNSVTIISKNVMWSHAVPVAC